jgi:flagellar biosynthesis/type III secretory pathway chaperone
MESMLRLQTQLLELAEEKTKVIIDNRVNDLARITAAETKLIRQVGECEADCAEAVRNLLDARGFPPRTAVTMSGLIKFITNPDEKEALIQLRQQLNDTIDRLKQRNELNQTLIKDSLAFINYTIDLTIGNPDEDMLYGRDVSGKATHHSGRGMFDTRA